MTKEIPTSPDGPIKEPRSSSGFEIWNNLVDAPLAIVAGIESDAEGLTSAKLAGKIEKLIYAGEVRRVIMFGEPGVGKTTNLRQLGRKLTESTDEKWYTDIEYVEHDEILRQTDDLFPDLPRPQWGRSEWAVFSNKVYDAAMKKGESVLQIAELVGVGTKNRGRSALGRIARDSSDTFFMGFVPNLDLQNRTKKIREAALNAENDQVEEALKSFGISVAWGDRSLAPDSRGEELKKIISKMARPEHIDNISREVLEESSAEEDSSAAIPQLLLDATPEVIEHFRRKFKYMLDLAGELNLTANGNRSGIVYNHPSTGPVIWHIAA